MESSVTSESSRRLRSEARSLPRSADELVALFRRVIELPRLQVIEVTGDKFTVSRLVAEGEAVIPEEHDVVEVDADFVIRKVQEASGLVELPFEPQRHPHMALLEATEMVVKQRLRPTFLIAPEGEWLSAFLGLPEGAIPESCFGMRVIYTENELFENKVLVLGGTTNLLTDVSYGVVIDMGD